MLFTLALVLLLPATAAAQEREREPISPFAADVRVALPRFPDDAAIATALGVTAENLPGRGLGLSAGMHFYPIRGKVALGLGAELLISRASRTLEPTVKGGPDGPTVKGRFNAFSPQVSLNFGGRRGWSYITVGFGWGQFTVEQETDPVSSPDGRFGTLNYGGGARWFAKEHLAFTIDLRFHRFDAQEASVGRPAYPGASMMVFSAGISVK
jgi:Outer membrane protein beta-barrel domain